VASRTSGAGARSASGTTGARVSAAAVAPLLLELARAVRAREFYGPTEAALARATDRAAQVWRSGLARIGELRIELERGRFELPGGAPVHSPGVDHLARNLSARSIERLWFRGGEAGDEIRQLVEAIACADATSSGGGFEQLLQSAGVQHITASRRGFSGLGQTRAPTPGPGATSRSADSPALQTETPSGPTVLLIRHLAELERASSVGEYRTALSAVETALEPTVDGPQVDGSRAVRVLARHSCDDGRDRPVRDQARQLLHRLMRDSKLRDRVIDEAYGPEGLRAVSSTQVLTALGATAVCHLFDRLETGDAAVRSQTTGLLIAMGPEALPGVVEELGSALASRARLAARVLGDMQNPGGIEFLADNLRHAEDSVRRECALALGRIGDDRAAQALGKALESGPQVASLAATALGACRGRGAVQILIKSAAERRLPEPVLREVVKSLGRMGHASATPVLRDILSREPWLGRARLRSLRVAAAQSLGRIGDSAALAALRAQASKGDAAVREACGEALRRIHAES